MSRAKIVYSEFLTNLAVAWFSAGVIAPLFTQNRGWMGILNSMIALVASLVSLKLAVLFREEENNDR